MREAGPAALRAGAGPLLRDPQEEHPALQQLHLPHCLSPRPGGLSASGRRAGVPHVGPPSPQTCVWNKRVTCALREWAQERPRGRGGAAAPPSCSQGVQQCAHPLAEGGVRPRPCGHPPLRSWCGSSQGLGALRRGQRCPGGVPQSPPAGGEVESEEREMVQRVLLKRLQGHESPAR